jgi:serine/threonine protein kinase
MVGRRLPTRHRRGTARFRAVGARHDLGRAGPRLAMRAGMRVVRTMPMRLGQYLLTEVIGAGGMACVYRGKRRGASGFETAVVVKTLLPEHRRNHKYVRMFKEEARLSAQLAHANVVRVHDFGLVAGIPFLEMEYLTGWNVQELWNATTARGQRLPLPIALHLITEACRGLAYAHSFVDDKGVHRPIVHRDVSPGNVMICRDGSVKLVDFGLAQLTRGETLEIDMFLGKLAYMSPEQLERRQLDRRADVFALGVTLYELVTGKRLFACASNVETLKRLQTLVIDPPSSINREAPAALDAVVLRALHRDPDQRYQSAAEMLAALDALGARLATRAELLSYLGALAPSVFSRTCDGCGARIAWGAECTSCKTYAEPSPFDDAEEEEDNDETPLPEPLPLRTRTLPIRWMQRRWLLLTLTLCVWWRCWDAWMAERRARAIP